MSNDPFVDPAKGGGDKLPIPELTEESSLVLFTVREALSDVVTEYGPSNPVRVDLAVLDGSRKGETFTDGLVFQRVLAGSLRSHVGKMVLGRLGLGVKKGGQNAPYILNDATEDDKVTGRKYLAHVAANPVPDPPSDEPF